MANRAPGRWITYRTESGYRFLDPTDGTEISFDGEPFGYDHRYRPKFSPNGQIVACIYPPLERGEGPRLCALTLEDHSLRILRKLEPRSGIWFLSWSNEGDCVYTVEAKKEGASVVKTPISTSVSETLIQLPNDVFEAAVDLSGRQSGITSDGTAFYFTKREFGSDVWMVEQFDPSLASSAWE